MKDKETLRNMKRKMYSNLEGFLKDLENYIKEEVEHKHQVSMQCAREGAREEFAEKLKKELKKENSSNPDVNAIISRGQVIDIINKLSKMEKDK